jgi:hypothetical protein
LMAVVPRSSERMVSLEVPKLNPMHESVRL